MASLRFQQDDEEEQLLAQALYVDQDLADEADLLDEQLPATGEEYLRKVIRESKKLEFVKTAENADELLGRAPEQPTHVGRSKAEAGEDVLPSQDWQNKQVVEFTNVRLKIARNIAYLDSTGGGDEKRIKFPSNKNEEAWCKFCFGDEFWASILKAEAEESETSETKQKTLEPCNSVENQPSLKILVSLKQPQITRLLEWQAEWAETIGHVSLNQALWFYALLSIVEKPLHPDVISSMRSFVLVCSKQRSSNLSQKSTHLNLIICLVSKYFGQSDLSD